MEEMAQQRRCLTMGWESCAIPEDARWRLTALYIMYRLVLKSRVVYETVDQIDMFVKKR